MPFMPFSLLFGVKIWRYTLHLEFDEKLNTILIDFMEQGKS